jgi:hypothetical protein
MTRTANQIVMVSADILFSRSGASHDMRALLESGEMSIVDAEKRRVLGLRSGHVLKGSW